MRLILFVDLSDFESRVPAAEDECPPVGDMDTYVVKLSTGNGVLSSDKHLELDASVSVNHHIALPGKPEDSSHEIRGHRERPATSALSA